jgi:hypothetical protein
VSNIDAVDALKARETIKVGNRREAKDCRPALRGERRKVGNRREAKDCGPVLRGERREAKDDTPSLRRGEKLWSGVEGRTMRGEGRRTRGEKLSSVLAGERAVGNRGGRTTRGKRLRSGVGRRMSGGEYRRENDVRKKLSTGIDRRTTRQFRHWRENDRRRKTAPALEYRRENDARQKTELWRWQENDATAPALASK